MAETARVRSCEECGWPALVEARRCPYCRARLPRVRRSAQPSWRSDPLWWAAIIWVGVMACGAVVTLLTLGWPLALMPAIGALAPAVFAVMLYGRTAIRIRSLSRRARTAKRPRAQATDERRTSTRDAGQR